LIGLRPEDLEVKALIPIHRAGRAAVAAAALALTTAALAPLGCAHTSPAQRAGDDAKGDTDDAQRIGSVLQQLATAIQTKDVDAIQRLYDFPDSVTAAAKRREYEAGSGLDTLTCAIRAGEVAIQGEGDRASAMAMREITYRENGRTQADAKWLTYEFRRVGGAWRVTSDADRDYARARFTNLSVRLDPDAGTMSGTATVSVEILQPGEDNLIFQLNRGLSIIRLTDDSGRELTPTRTADAIVIPLSTRPAQGDSITINIAFAGGLFNERKEQGYSQVSIAPEGCFASWVTSWYPHLQGTGSKSRGRIAFDVPAAFTVASSGRPVERTNVGDRAHETFAVNVPLDYSFAAAPYFHRERTVDGVALGVFLLQGGEVKADLYLTECARILAYERKIYATYPFDGYAVVEIPAKAAGTLGGSSEQGMNLFPEGMLPNAEVPLPLLAHEMGHSWWGNLITSSDGPIIAEGLAQLSAVLCIREFEGEAGMRRFLKYGWPAYHQSARMYFADFAPSPARDLPIATTRQGAADVAILHDLADTKGHFVYNMLREKIGDEAFLGGLQAIIARHAGGTITLGDLKTEWERTSGGNLSDFFAQWFYRSGAPEFALADTVESTGDGYEVRGTIRQLRETYDVEAEVVAALENGPVVKKIPVAGRETPFAFTVSSGPAAVLFDPDYKLLRWTDEFTEDSLMQKVQSLRSIGMKKQAIADLEKYLEDHPESFAARYELGVCQEGSGKTAEAERQFRFVCDRYAAYPAYNPSVPVSMIHLGHICDRTDRREEAVALYRKVLEIPDVAGSRAEAGALLVSPFRPQVRPVLPSADVLRRYAGTYADPFLGSFEVSFGDAGLVVSGRAHGFRAYLALIQGSLFRITSREGATLEFVQDDAGTVTEAIARMSGRGFHLVRQEGTAH
jgi:tetratricopeptide (TPR) repeat protein/ketosteroid isomerase-like protein